MSTQQQNQPQGQSLPEKVINQIQVSSIGLEKAAEELGGYREKQAKAQELIPKVCDALVQHERVMPQQREKLAEALKDPVQALELMIKLAGHRNSEELANLGRGVDSGNEKQAAAQDSPFVGQRTSQIKQSDRKLYQGLGLSAPVE